MRRPLAQALVLDFGGVISKTLFETHDLTERTLGLAPCTLKWLGPFAPEVYRVPFPDVYRGINAHDALDEFFGRIRAEARAAQPGAVVRA